MTTAAACSADTIALDNDGGQADASVVDASPPDAASAPDAAPRRDASVAPHCVPATRAVELNDVGDAIDIDFAPRADRVLVLDRGGFQVFALPSGDPGPIGVHNAQTATPRFTYDGRDVVLDVGGGELRLVALEGGLQTRLSSDYACEYELTADRRYLVALVGCRPLTPDRRVGRLEIYDLEARGLVHSEDNVLSASVVATDPSVVTPRLAYLRHVGNTPCSRCPTFEGELTEVALNAPGAPLPPPTPLRLTALYGYALGGTTLLGGRGACVCEAADPQGAWDARTGTLLAAGTVYTGVRDYQLGTTPGVLGRDGVVVTPSPAGRAVYAPYAGGAPLELALYDGIPLSILSRDGADRGLLAFGLGVQLVRLSLGASGSPMLLGPESSPSVSAGASRDRERLAVAIESPEGVFTLQSGPASGELELNSTSRERTTLVTVLPDGRGVLARMGPSHLALFRGTERVDLANDLLESGRVFVDEGTCWVAARREATDTVRVLPLP